MDTKSLFQYLSIGQRSDVEAVHSRLAAGMPRYKQLRLRRGLNHFAGYLESYGYGSVDLFKANSIKEPLKGWIESLKKNSLVNWGSFYDDCRACVRFFEGLHEFGLAEKFKILIGRGLDERTRRAFSLIPQRSIRRIKELLPDSPLLARQITEFITAQPAKLSISVLRVAVRELCNYLEFCSDKDPWNACSFLSWEVVHDARTDRKPDGLRASASALIRLLNTLIAEGVVGSFELPDYSREEYIDWFDLVSDEDLAARISSFIENHRLSCAPSTFMRRRRASVAFFKKCKTVSDKPNYKDAHWLQMVWMKWREDWYRNRTNEAGTTSVGARNDDYGAARNMIGLLIGAKILPSFSMPKSSKKIQKAASQSKRTVNDLSFTNLRPNSAINNVLWNPQNLYLSDTEFLDLYQNDLHRTIAHFRFAAEAEIKSAVHDFELGQKFINECDIKKLRSIIYSSDSGVDVDEGGISVFSPNHPDGLKNLVGWIYHEHRGRFFNRGFNGAHWVHRHGGADKVRRYLGMTPDVATAFSVILVLELGINVDSLRDLRSPRSGINGFFQATENANVFRVVWLKPRANKELSDLVFEQKDGKINAFYCFKKIFDLTENFRKYTESDNLWLFWNHSGSDGPKIISDGAWKSSFRDLVNRYDFLHQFKDRSPNLAKIRVSAGILEWFETGGDLEAAAKKLKNSVKVSIRNYIPPELMDIMYRRQIRRFQNLMIVESSSTRLYQAAALGMTEDEFNIAMQGMLQGQKQNVFEKIDSEYNSKNNSKFIFLISPENVAILFLFCEAIERELEINLYDECFFNVTISGLSLRQWLDLKAILWQKIPTTDDYSHRALFDQGIALVNDFRKTVDFSGFIWKVC